VIGDVPKLPLFDVNEVFIREVSADECQELIDLGEAERTDIGLKLTRPGDCDWSLSCPTARDAQLLAGEYGETDEANAARGKLAHWRDAR
jgi:hypothetical protein